MVQFSIIFGFFVNHFIKKITTRPLFVLYDSHISHVGLDLIETARADNVHLPPATFYSPTNVVYVILRPQACQTFAIMFCQRNINVKLEIFNHEIVKLVELMLDFLLCARNLEVGMIKTVLLMFN